MIVSVLCPPAKGLGLVWVGVEAASYIDYCTVGGRGKMVATSRYSRLTPHFILQQLCNFRTYALCSASFVSVVIYS